MSGKKSKEKKPGILRSAAESLDGLTPRAREAADSSLTRGQTLRRDGLTGFRAGLSPGKAVKLKRRAAALVEGSFLAQLPGRISGYLFTMQAKSLAVFLLSFVLAAVLISLLKSYFSGAEISYFELALPLLPAAFALPLVFTEKSLSSLAGDSPFLRRFLIERIGVGTAKLGVLRERRHSSAVMFGAGTLLGILTYFFGISGVMKVAGAICALSFIFAYPESGFIFTAAFAPFFSLASRPGLFIGVCVASAAAGFFVKWSTGRRSFYYTPGTVPFILLFAAVLFSSIGRDGSLPPALASCLMMLGFPLAVNLIRDEKRLSLFASSVSISALVVSAAGLVQFICGLAPSGWTDTSSFPEITSRAAVFFSNPNMLAFWLCCAFPFTLYEIHASARLRRLSRFLPAVFTLLCSVVTFSRNGWLGIAAGGLLFLLFLSIKYLLAVPACALGAGLCGLAFNGGFGSRLFGFFSLNDTANVYRIKVWNGALLAACRCLLTGVGAGDGAFRSLYLLYALPGAGTAPHSHSIYLQQVIETGLPGLLFLLIFFAVLVRSAAGAYGSRLSLTVPRLIGAAAFAAVSAMMLCGVFDNVFYNYRILLTFWTMAGVAFSAFSLPDRQRTIDFT